MVSFIVDEHHLRQLSPETRNELLQVVTGELVALRRELLSETWDPEGNRSYPLNVDEARVLIRGLPEAARRMLRSFCRNFDGTVGTVKLDELMSSSGHETYDDLGQEVANITQRVRAVTGNNDAWLFNWNPRDWEWDEAKGSYTRGEYYISAPAIAALRTAFGMGEAQKT